MSFVQCSLLLMLFGLSGSSIAENIFNIQPTRQERPAAQPSVVRQEAGSRLAAPPPADTKPTPPQFERRPNESDEALQARMNALSQRSLADLQRATREQNERMKALAPK